jgi:hypothetical protein
MAYNFLNWENREHRDAYAAATANVPAPHKEAVNEVIQFLLNSGFSWPAVFAFLAANLPEIIKILSGGETIPGIIAWVAALINMPAPTPVPVPGPVPVAAFAGPPQFVGTSSSVFGTDGAFFWKADAASPAIGPFETLAVATASRNKAVGCPGAKVVPLLPPGSTAFAGATGVFQNGQWWYYQANPDSPCYGPFGTEAEAVACCK